MRAGLQRGAALVEFHIAAVLALLPLLLGILQMGLLLAGYHVLSLAASEAARAGSIDHARPAGMRDALADGLVPLLIDLTRVDDRGGPLELVAEARIRAAIEVARNSRIERLSPSAADFTDHARDGAIPNDALEHRSSAAGRAGNHSLQEANLLRIRVHYCHALVVPLVNRLLPATLRLLDPDPANQLCYADGRVPLRVTSSAPMQSEAWP